MDFALAAFRSACVGQVFYFINAFVVAGSVVAANVPAHAQEIDDALTGAYGAVYCLSLVHVLGGYCTRPATVNIAPPEGNARWPRSRSSRKSYVRV